MTEDGKPAASGSGHLADRLSWLCLALGAGVVVASLASFWGANTAYADRFLILVGAAYAAITLRPYWLATPMNPRPVLGGIALVVGIFSILPALFLLPQIGPRTLLLWWMSGSVLLTTVGFVLQRHGLGRLRVMLFPLLFGFFALPIPNRILVPLQDQLQTLTTSVSYRALQALGQEVIREGFVLALPAGRLRVEEACSGVQSLTALTAIAAFVAFLRGFGPIRGISLVLLSVPLVAAVNILRVVVSGLLQEWAGPKYVQGAWHEGLGFGAVLIGLGLILCVAPLLGAVQTNPVPENAAAVPTSRGRVAAAVLVLGTILAIGMAWRGHQAVEETAMLAPLAEVRTEFDGWQAAEQPIPAVVQDLLSPDQAIYRVYTNNVGRQAHAWLLFWNSGAVIKGYHHPDVCWGNKGFSASERWREDVEIENQLARIPATAREFRQGNDRQVVLYWTQEGSRVWTDADEESAARDVMTASWRNHGWVTDLLGGRMVSTGPRLVVVVVVPGVGPSVRRDAASVAGELATDIYRLCPWARPSS